MAIILNGFDLTIEKLVKIARFGEKVELSNKDSICNDVRS